jgi:hypothetical protein
MESNNSKNIVSTIEEKNTDIKILDPSPSIEIIFKIKNHLNIISIDLRNRLILLKRFKSVKSRFNAEKETFKIMNNILKTKPISIEIPVLTTTLQIDVLEIKNVLRSVVHTHMEP